MKKLKRRFIEFLVVVIMAIIFFAFINPVNAQEKIADAEATKILSCYECGAEASGNFCSECGALLDSLSSLSLDPNLALRMEVETEERRLESLERTVNKEEREKLLEKKKQQAKRRKILEDKMRTLSSGRIPPEPGMYFGRDGRWHFPEGDLRGFARHNP